MGEVVEMGTACDASNRAQAGAVAGAEAGELVSL